MREMKFGARMKALRIAKKWTLREFCGLETTMIRRMERSNSPPPNDYVIRCWMDMLGIKALSTRQKILHIADRERTQRFQQRMRTDPKAEMK